jgi:putative ABC transport system substrate-binding protein
MRRRDFIATVGAAMAAAALPYTSFGQPARVRRLAFLSLASPERVEALRAGMAEYGYVEGRNFVIDLFIPPTTGETRAFAERAVASNPDVILTGTTPATQFAKAWTANIPIVMMGINDPVGNGLVASFVRPGGNVTGNTGTAVDLAGKQVAVLKEFLPTLKRLAVLALPADPSNPLIVAEVRAAARALGVEPVVFEFVEADDFTVQLERVASADVQAFWAVGTQYFAVRDEVLHQFQLRTRIPRFTHNPSLRPLYSVIAYGAERIALYRQAAYYVDAILKGTKPAELPVQTPSVFDLAINLATVKAIGLTVPPSILAQATTLVE